MLDNYPQPNYQEEEEEEEINKALWKAGGMLVWFLSMIAGGACLGIGTWILTDRNFFSAMFGTTLMEVSAFLLATGGGFCIIIAVLACCGACCESRFCLLAHLCCCILATLAIFVGAILAVVFKVQVDQNPEHARNYMRESIQNEYGVYLHREWNRVITKSWDETQERLWCCAVEEENWVTYQNSEWYKTQPGVIEYDKPAVPPSCCVKSQYGKYLDLQKCQTWPLGPPHKPGIVNEGLFYRGCYNAIREFSSEHCTHLIGVGLSMAFLQLPAIFMSFAMTRRVFKNPVKKKTPGGWGTPGWSSPDYQYAYGQPNPMLRMDGDM